MNGNWMDANKAKVNRVYLVGDFYNDFFYADILQYKGNGVWTGSGGSTQPAPKYIHEIHPPIRKG